MQLNNQAEKQVEINLVNVTITTNRSCSKWLITSDSKKSQMQMLKCRSAYKHDTGSWEVITTRESADRGMMGIRLVRDLLYTGPHYNLAQLHETVERAGLQIENIIISPLTDGKTVWMKANVFRAGDRYGVGKQQCVETSTSYLSLKKVAPDISKVLKTSQKVAEKLWSFHFMVKLCAIWKDFPWKSSLVETS